MKKTMRQYSFSGLIILICYALLTVTGCGLRAVPEVERSAVWLKMKERSRQYHIDRTWWTHYQQPELNTLILLALSQNIDLQRSQLAVQKALYRLRLSREDFWPTASAGLSGQKNKNLDSGRENMVLGSDLGLRYELDLWQKVAARTQADKYGWQASQQDLRAARLSLVFAVLDGWFQLASLDQSILLMQKNVDCYQQMEEISQLRYTVGKTGRIALTQSRQALLGAQIKLLSLRERRDDVLTTLRGLLNLAPPKLENLHPPPLASLPRQQVNLAIPISVLGERPDLLAAEFRLQEAWSRQQAQYRSWYPKISLSAGIKTSTSQPGKIFEMPVGLGSVALALPFLQWNTLTWQDKLAEADFKDAQLAFAKKFTTALNEVSSAYQHYRQAQKNLAWNEEELVLDQENSRHYQLRYDAGSAELADWLRALAAQYTTEQTIVQQHYQILRYENLIYKAMAGRYFN